MGSFETRVREIEDNIRSLMDSGVPEDKIISQMEIFQKGFSFTPLVRSCTLGDGIDRILSEQYEMYLSAHDQALAAGRLTKFVPASGAATRMFKSLLALRHDPDRLSTAASGQETEDADIQFVREFMDGLERFAFGHALETVLKEKKSDLFSLRAEGRWMDILKALLDPDGLGYGDTPKGLVQFHRYEAGSRSAFEEHLVEARNQAHGDSSGIRLHYTLAKPHATKVKAHIEAVRSRYETDEKPFDIGFSTQKKSTNTIAVDMENKAFRTLENDLAFRPGGHGALLANLDDLDADIVLIKNIDNVVPDAWKKDTLLWKRLLTGRLVHLQRQTFDVLKRLENPAGLSLDDLSEMAEFCRSELHLSLPEGFGEMDLERRVQALFSLLNRPMRVCGMVKNQGDPGGGPFWAADRRYGTALQIVESAQVDMADPEQATVLKTSTHFNPVDLVCGIRDFRGRLFDLERFADHNSGFITTKSSQGRSLKAMELPGLWNGSMAFWITLFVEVPQTTFNPVKTVNDLLKPAHQ